MTAGLLGERRENRNPVRRQPDEERKHYLDPEEWDRMKDKEASNLRSATATVSPKPSHEQERCDKMLILHFHLGKDCTDALVEGPQETGSVLKQRRSRAQQRDHWPRSRQASWLHWGFPKSVLPSSFPGPQHPRLCTHLLGSRAPRIGGRVIASRFM